MSEALRVLLLIVSLFSIMIMMRKIRHAKFQIEYSIFWIIFAIALLAMAAFPNAVGWFAELFGIQSPVNMVFLAIIFVLMVKLFYMNIHISQLEYKVKELVQKLALNDYDNEHKDDNENSEGEN